MAKPYVPPPVQPPALKLAVAVARLKEMKARLEKEAAKGSLTREESDTLDYALKSVLRDALGENHPDIVRICSAGGSGLIIKRDESYWARDRADRFKHRAGLLGELVAKFERDIAEAPAPAPTTPTLVKPTALEQVERMVKRFHRAALQLRKRHGGRAAHVINDEYDVQDLLHALLRLHFDDVRPEEVSPSYAGKSSRMDFLLKAEQLVVEVKMTRDSLGEKDVGGQLIEDIARYAKHPDCKTLVCFVYDPEHRISNPDGIEHDLSGTRDGLPVKVFIAPRS